jgi:hypothetical protein
VLQRVLLWLLLSCAATTQVQLKQNSGIWHAQPRHQHMSWFVGGAACPPAPQVPRDLAKVAIESGYYHLKAANLTAQVRF